MKEFRSIFKQDFADYIETNQGTISNDTLRNTRSVLLKCDPVYRSSYSFEKALPGQAAECRAASLCGLGLCPAKSGHRADIAVRA